MFLPLLHTLCLLIIYSFKEISALKWRVFEGKDLRYDVHKYLVKLKLYDHDGLASMCSGSIVSETWIITSAHCIHPNLHKVTVLHRNKNSVKIIAEVDNCDVYPHPDYTIDVNTVRESEKDVALLYVRQPIEFGSSIGLIKISTRDPKIGGKGIIAGYGESDTGFVKPKEGAVMITSCPYNNGNIICTKGPVRAGSGDSGGPLIYKGRLAGLISSSCVDVHVNRMCFTIYTSVAANIDWMREIVEEVASTTNSNGSC